MSNSSWCPNSHASPSATSPTTDGLYFWGYLDESGRVQGLMSREPPELNEDILTIQSFHLSTQFLPQRTETRPLTPAERAQVASLFRDIPEVQLFQPPTLTPSASLTSSHNSQALWHSDQAMWEAMISIPFSKNNTHHRTVNEPGVCATASLARQDLDSAREEDEEDEGSQRHETAVTEGSRTTKARGEGTDQDDPRQQAQWKVSVKTARDLVQAIRANGVILDSTLTKMLGHPTKADIAALRRLCSVDLDDPVRSKAPAGDLHRILTYDVNREDGRDSRPQVHDWAYEIVKDRRTLGEYGACIGKRTERGKEIYQAALDSGLSVRTARRRAASARSTGPAKAKQKAKGRRG